MNTISKSILMTSCSAAILMFASIFPAYAHNPDSGNPPPSPRATQKPTATPQTENENSSSSSTSSSARQTSTLDDLLKGIEDVFTGGTGGNLTPNGDNTGETEEYMIRDGDANDFIYGDVDFIHNNVTQHDYNRESSAP